MVLPCFSHLGRDAAAGSSEGADGYLHRLAEAPRAENDEAVTRAAA